MTVAKKPLPQDLIDALLANYKKPEDLIGEEGLLKQLTQALVERALHAEMAEHLGHGKNEPVANVTGNTRHGKSQKTLKGDFGERPIEIPRDRHGRFEPPLIAKHQTRWTGFDDKILSLYARWKLRDQVAADLKKIHQSATAEEGETRLGEFEQQWNTSHPPIAQSWRRYWPRIIPFFDYPPEIRRVIHATNAIESVNVSF